MVSKQYYDDIKQRSIKNLVTHKMKVLQDDGLRRHLSFRREDGRFTYSFDLVTWPDYLCITGDMGCYVFSRIEDMFEFFYEPGMSDGINPNYWAEKLKSDCKRDGWSEFDSDGFEQTIKEIFERWEFESEEEKDSVWNQIELDVFCNTAEEAYNNIAQFSSDDTDHGFDSDFYIDYGPWNRPTTSYLFCLWAIVHGIKMYDEFKESVKS